MRLVRVIGGVVAAVGSARAACRRGFRRCAIGSAAILGAAGAAHAQVFDITSDWSNAANPNGAWSFRHGESLLPAVAAWQGICVGGWATAQPGWAVSECSQSRIPFWFRSNGSETFVHDFLEGDVVIHSRDDANGIGNGEGRAVWTSPSAGIVDVDGAIWMGRDIGRANHWSLFRNGTLLTSGDISDGDPYSRANPMTLDLGSGGAGALKNIAVAAGDTIALEVVRTSFFGDFAGVRLTLHLSGGGCYPDCDGSGGLNVNDYICFQTKFALGDPYADCDNNGVRNVNDYICFQTKFALGC